MKISKEQYQKLKEELEYLETEGRKKIAEMLKAAASHGDLSENAEYSISKEEQMKLERRILEIKKIIENAQIISTKDNNYVNVGNKVKLLDLKTNKTFEIEIVGYGEVDPVNGKISENSPLGKVLIGKKIGDVVKYAVGDKDFSYKILEIL